MQTIKRLELNTIWKELEKKSRDLKMKRRRLSRRPSEMRRSKSRNRPCLLICSQWALARSKTMTSIKNQKKESKLNKSRKLKMKMKIGTIEYEDYTNDSYIS